MRCAKDGCIRQASNGNYCSEHKPEYGGTETRLRNKWEELDVDKKIDKKDKTDKNKSEE